MTTFPKRLLDYQSRHVQHMQKALTQMNIQLAQVISDVAGETGQKIIRAILAGEHDGQVLAKLRNGRIRASAEDIAKPAQSAHEQSASPEAGGGQPAHQPISPGRLLPPALCPQHG